MGKGLLDGFSLGDVWTIYRVPVNYDILMCILTIKCIQLF